MATHNISDDVAQQVGMCVLIHAYTEKGCSCSLARYDNQLTTETGTFICIVYYYKFSETDTNNFTASKPIPN